MRLFGRKTPTGERRPADFWSWWQREGRQSAEALIAGDLDPDTFAADIGQRLQASVPGAVWELTPGTFSSHVLVISAGGNPELRAGVRRLVLRSPEADETWSYRDARIPAEDPESISLGAPGATEVRLSEVVVGAKLAGSRFDVTVHHPSFAELSEENRLQIAFLSLDAALGEMDTEVWIGAITPSEVAPIDGFGLAALRAAVADVKSRFVDADGQPTWAMLEGDGPQGPILATAQTPLHPWSAPHLDTHVAVIVPFTDQTEEGLPGPSSLDALRAFEDELSGAVGEHARIVAHQTTQGVRVLHVYADSGSPALDQIAPVTTRWTEGKVDVSTTHDPGWESVQHLRT